MTETERKCKVEKIKELLQEVSQNGDAALFMLNKQAGVVAHGTPQDLAAAISAPLQSLLLQLGESNLRTMNVVATVLVTNIIGAVTIAHKEAGASADEYAKAMVNLEANVHNNEIMLKACEIAQAVKAMSAGSQKKDDDNFFASLIKDLFKK